MLRIVGYGFVFLVAQIAFIILFVVAGIALDIRMPLLDSLVAYLYLWPLMLLPPMGAHGGELFFAPFAAGLYAVLFGVGMNAWQNFRSR